MMKRIKWKPPQDLKVGDVIRWRGQRWRVVREAVVGKYSIHSVRVEALEPTDVQFDYTDKVEVES